MLKVIFFLNILIIIFFSGLSIARLTMPFFNELAWQMSASLLNNRIQSVISLSHTLFLSLSLFLSLTLSLTCSLPFPPSFYLSHSLTLSHYLSFTRSICLSLSLSLSLSHIFSPSFTISPTLYLSLSPSLSFFSGTNFWRFFTFLSKQRGSFLAMILKYHVH